MNKQGAREEAELQLLVEGVWALPLLPSRPRILSRLKPLRRVSPLPSSSCDTEIHAGPEARKWNELPCTPGHLHTWTRGRSVVRRPVVSGARPASPHRHEPPSAHHYLTDVYLHPWAGWSTRKDPKATFRFSSCLHVAV